MAASTQQKVDFLLKKIGYTATKTGIAEDGSISGTKKSPSGEAIASPLVIPSTSIWADSDLIPTTPPGSDSSEVKVYLAGTSGLRMTADSTVAGSRSFIAYTTYNNTGSDRLTNWIDTQFGSSYIIKVYKGDPNSGGTQLSAAGSGNNDGWFFDYSSGVLNFNDTNVPSGVTDTNIYIVGYRYIGVLGVASSTGVTALTHLTVSGIATFTQSPIFNQSPTFSAGLISNIYSTGVSTVSGFRFPTSDGTEDQAMVTDGSGNLSFKTIEGGGGATGAATTISTGITTATSGQTVFTTTHPHNDGTDTYSHQVFLNGLKMRPSDAGAATRDFAASSNSTITFYSGVNVGDEVRTVVYFGHTYDEEYFIATAGQTVFALSGNLTAQKNFKVYVNGVKLRNGTDYGVASPVTLIQGAKNGDHIDIMCDNAEDQFTATEGQTAFTPTSTEISEDNMQVYHNGIALNLTEDYTIGSPSVSLTLPGGAGLSVGDHVDIVIRRS